MRRKEEWEKNSSARLPGPTLDPTKSDSCDKMTTLFGREPSFGLGLQVN